MTPKNTPEKAKTTKQKAVDALQRLEQTLHWLDEEEYAEIARRFLVAARNVLERLPIQ
jgi:hypothetical protein